MSAVGRWSVGQVLVTDPSAEGSSGGYQLVAASPGLAPQWLDHLERHPGVSDHLHQLGDDQAAHASHFSFFPLPEASGERPWAFSRRFLRGKRRGSYNRILAHTLVLRREVLDALAWDPWLLLGRDRLRVDGRSVAFPGLGDALDGPPFPDALPEVELVPPDDPLAERLQALERRRAFLVEVLDDGQGAEGVLALSRLLGSVYRAAAGDASLALPQGAESEQLLALAWSSLPRRDRQSTPWTTHLGSADTQFRLAASPQQPPGWSALADFPPPHAAASLSAAEWAELVAAGPSGESSLLEPVLKGAEREDHRISLSKDRGVPAAGWVAFCRAGGRIPADGFPDAATLEGTLGAFDLASGDSLERPWLGAGILLQSSAATVRNQSEGAIEEPDAAAVADAVADALERLRIADRVADPEVLESLAAHDPSLASWAAALVVRRLPSGTADVRARVERLDDLVTALAERSSGTGAAEAAILVDLDARLAARLLELRSPRLRQALDRVMPREGGLEAVRSHLDRSTTAGPRRDPGPLLALLDMAALSGDDAAGRSNRAAAAKIARLDLVPALATKEVAEDLSADEIELVLDALSRNPIRQAGAEGLAQALLTWDGKAFDLAADRLRTRAPHDPELALATSRSVLAARGPTDAAVLLRPRSSRLGLAETLDSLEAEPDLWVPFALDEAAWLDEAGTPAEHEVFASFCARLDLSRSTTGGRPAARAAALFLEGFRTATGTVPGAAHRHLFSALIPGCVAYPRVAREALEERVFRSVEPGLAAVPGSASRIERLDSWAPVVLELARGLEGAGTREPSTLAQRWWNAYHEASAGQRAIRARLPEEAVGLLRILAPEDRQEVVRRWLDRVADLPQDQEALLDAFAEVARSEPGLHFDFTVVRSIRELRSQQATLEEVTAAVDALAWRAGRFQQRLARGFDRMLPSSSRSRAALVLELLGSPRVWPTSKEVLLRVLDQSLNAAGEAAVGALPDLEAFAAHPLAPLRVGAFLGRHWEADPQRSVELLRQALDLESRPFLQSFLQGAGRSRRRKLLRHLARERDRDLERRLRRMVEAPRHWDLAPFRGELAADEERP